MMLDAFSIRFVFPFAAALALMPSCKSDDGGGDTAADEHGAGEHGASEASAGEHGADTHDHSVDSDGTDPAVAYCSCMLANCHEPYHTKFGEDEMAAEAACLAEAGAVPSNGAPTEMGNFIECRQHFCDAAMADPTVCTNALGDAVCM
ncbi:MAG: hypothetical protein K1X88_06210 [Nannocystaceae bacterium]|nr:hypothetical protein [Nannocystaceae bacterium]